MEVEMDEFNQKEKSNPKQKPYYTHKTIACEKSLTMIYILRNIEILMENI